MWRWYRDGETLEKIKQKVRRNWQKYYCKYLQPKYSRSIRSQEVCRQIYRLFTECVQLSGYNDAVQILNNEPHINNGLVQLKALRLRLLSTD